jgi:uncharacterized protein (DUF885 family)
MRLRVPFLIAGAALFTIGLSLAVPPCFGQDGNIQDILDDLEGLQFDEFVDASYKHVLLRTPELVTSMGLSQTLGSRDDQLDNICNEFVIETYELKAGIHEILKSYDREALSYEQQISYDSYDWILEGWALYAEYLAMEMGWYENDLYSELGRLQWELLRAARLVVDTGLHHYRWSRQQAIDYYVDAVGATTALATQQIDLYLYYVGYFTAYKTGMLKILELRQHAMDELGEGFDIKEFHRTVLLHNRLPLPLLERLVDDYIEETQRRRLARIPRRPSGRRYAG